MDVWLKEACMSSALNLLPGFDKAFEPGALTQMPTASTLYEHDILYTSVLFSEPV